MTQMYRLVKIIFLLALISLGLSFYFIKQPPPKNDFLSDLQQSPLQAPTDKQEFSIEKNGITYNKKQKTPQQDILKEQINVSNLDSYYRRNSFYILIKITGENRFS